MRQAVDFDRQRSIDARTIFENLRRKIEQQIILLPDNTPLKITTSIGVCTTLEKNLEHALGKADNLLYEAKKSGRNRVILI